jgi:hypothetical protein
MQTPVQAPPSPAHPVISQVRSLAHSFASSVHACPRGNGSRLRLPRRFDLRSMLRNHREPCHIRPMQG